MYGSIRSHPNRAIHGLIGSHSAIWRCKAHKERFAALYHTVESEKGSVCTSVWTAPNQGVEIKVEKMFGNAAFQFRDSIHIPWASNPAIYQRNWPDGCWEIQDFQKSGIIVSERGKWLPDTLQTHLEALCMLQKLWQYIWRKFLATHGSYLTSIGQVVEPHLSKIRVWLSETHAPHEKTCWKQHVWPKKLGNMCGEKFGYSDLISD